MLAALSLSAEALLVGIAALLTAVVGAAKYLDARGTAAEQRAIARELRAHEEQEQRERRAQEERQQFAETLRAVQDSALQSAVEQNRDLTGRVQTLEGRIDEMSKQHAQQMQAKDALIEHLHEKIADLRTEHAAFAARAATEREHLVAQLNELRALAGDRRHSPVS